MPNAATHVDFYVLQSTEPSARLRFACRLAEKAYVLSHQIYAHAGTEADARRLNDLLWTFRGGSFVPHELVEPGLVPTAPVTIGCGTNNTGEGDLLIGRPESLRDDYTARFGAHRRGLADIMRSAGWSFAVHHTDQPAQAALLNLYTAMSVQSLATCS